MSVCVCVCVIVFVVHIQSCSFTDFKNLVLTHIQKRSPPPPKKKKEKKKVGSFAVLKLFVYFSWFITLNLINSE